MIKIHHSKYIILTLFLLLIFITIIPPNFKEELSIIYNNLLFKFISGIILISLAIIFNKEAFSVFVPSLFFIFIYIFEPLIPIQTNLINLDFTGSNFFIPILIYLTLVFAYKPFRKKVNYLRFGNLYPRTIYLMILLVFISSIALLLWTFLLKPDLTVFLEKIPDWGTGLVLLGGIGFAIINSLAEEFIFRGVMWDGLLLTISNIKIVILLQAFIFGVWHYHGFPGGFLGSSMVFIWGIFLGVIRYWSGGMFAPVLAHFFADITIFIILINY
jgi:membrane protease YdiL (CAAX protease family)